MKIKIIIEGRVISKKNHKVVGRNRYSGKQFFTSGKAWKNFEKDALSQLVMVRDVFAKNIKIDYKFYFKGNMFTDVDNAMAGINDILQLAGIIDDDKSIKQGSFEIINCHTEWFTEIWIEQM